MVLPGRNPIVLAKELATLDRLSNGRLSDQNQLDFEFWFVAGRGRRHLRRLRRWRISRYARARSQASTASASADTSEQLASSDTLAEVAPARCLRQIIQNS